MTKNNPALEELAGRKILFASFPADGHVNPLTGLAVYLKNLGCDVRWYTGSVYAGKIGRLGIPFYPFTKALDISADNADQLFPERAKINSKIKKLNFDLVNGFIMRAPENLEDIKDIHREFPFEIIIADVMFMAAPLVRAHFKVPFLSIGVMPNMENSCDLPPQGLGMEPSYTWAGKLKQRILRFMTTQVLFRPSDRLLNKVYKEHGIDSSDRFLFGRIMGEADIHLQIGAPGFEYYRTDLSSNIRYVGAMLPHSSGERKSPWFDVRLNQFDKIVVVTQGTVERDVEKIIVPTLEAMKDSDVLVIATTGGAATEELRRRFPHDNIIIEDFIPFDDIMPYADAYITNGGYGGVLLGISHQLPMVVAGIHEGKSEINARIGYFGYGINLKTERPDAKKLRHAIEEILLDKTYKANVIKLSEELARYQPYQLGAAYVKELLKGHTLLYHKKQPLAARA